MTTNLDGYLHHERAARSVKPSAFAYATGGYIRRHGFSPKPGREFCGAAVSVARRQLGQLGPTPLHVTLRIDELVGPLTGSSLATDKWTRQQAAAVCYIVGDLFAAEGR